MPQFDTTFFASQIFWTIISFVILFFLVNRWIIPPITRILQQRVNQIASDLDHAQQTLAQAEALKLEYTQKIENIEENAKKITAEAEKKWAKERDRFTAELEHKLQRKKEIFMADQEMLRKKTMQEMRNSSSELIVAAAEQLIHHKFSQQDAQAELEDIIAHLDAEVAQKK